MRCVPLARAVAGVAALLAAGATLRPALAQHAPAAGTYVLVDVSGEPLPASIPLGGTYRIVLIGRRLTLEINGTFHQTGPARIVAGRQPIALLPDAQGTYEFHGNEISLLPSGAEPIVATRRGSTLTYTDGGRSWLFLQCQPVIVVSACADCHRSPDDADPAATPTYRFAEACNDAGARP